MNDQWIPVTKELPEDEVPVLITAIATIYCGNEVRRFKNVTKAFYESGNIYDQDSAYGWDDLTDYDEEMDDYFVPEGWFVYDDYSESFVVIDDEVIAWMPIPRAYGEDVK